MAIFCILDTSFYIQTKEEFNVLIAELNTDHKQVKIKHSGVMVSDYTDRMDAFLADIYD